MKKYVVNRNVIGVHDKKSAAKDEGLQPLKTPVMALNIYSC